MSTGITIGVTIIRHRHFHFAPRNRLVPVSLSYFVFRKIRDVRVGGQALVQTSDK